MPQSPTDTRRAFVAGWPIAHSLSPVLHGHWLERYKIAGDYEAIPLEPDRLGTFLKNLPDSGYRGGNITIPHKQSALEICNRVSDEARAIGAVNTVWHQGNQLFGTNTDAYGFAANLDQYAPRWKKPGLAIVIGAGGAARAIVYALMQAGFTDIAIANRTAERASDLASEFGAPCRPLEWSQINDALAAASLLVNTSALGMTGHPDLVIDLDLASPGLIATDIVYAPLETGLLKQARARGLTTVDGLGMLLHQAAPGFEKWFGRKPAVDAELRAAVISALETRKSTS